MAQYGVDFPKFIHSVVVESWAIYCPILIYIIIENFNSLMY